MRRQPADRRIRQHRLVAFAEPPARIHDDKEAPERAAFRKVGIDQLPHSARTLAGTFAWP